MAGKKKRSAKQISATKRMIAARKKQLHQVKSNPRKKAKKKTGKKRAAKKTPVKKKTTTRKKAAPRASRDRRYYVQSIKSKNYWDGLGISAKTRTTAASFTNKQAALKVAQGLANALKRPFQVIG